MIWLIARQGADTYVGPMVAMIFRLLALFALTLMPIGMGLAPAEAAAPDAHAGMATAGEGHCDGTDETTGGKAFVGMHCASACSALPAEPARVEDATHLPAAPRVATLIHSCAGTAPPPATPPPRLG
jgi:hypothetical protein